MNLLVWPQWYISACDEFLSINSETLYGLSAWTVICDEIFMELFAF